MGRDILYCCFCVRDPFDGSTNAHHRHAQGKFHGNPRPNEMNSFIRAGFPFALLRKGRLQPFDLAQDKLQARPFLPHPVLWTPLSIWRVMALT